MQLLSRAEAIDGIIRRSSIKITYRKQWHSRTMKITTTNRQKQQQNHQKDTHIYNVMTSIEQFGN